jgi:hypothetical protein
VAWLRDEIWFDVNVAWFREGSGSGSSALALPAPALFGSAADAPLDIPYGLAASRQRRAELRRRRNARRARAAAFAIAPAAILPFAGQRLGIGSTENALAEDPPSLVRDVPAAGTAPVSRPKAGGRAAPARAQLPRIDWHRATSHGLQYAGWLSGGTQLPLEGPDWVTWNPVEDAVPNRRGRLYGHERTIRTLVSVLAAYRAANPEAPRVVIGDISFRNGGPMELHVSHQNGLDVDVYYPRLDGSLRAPRTRRQVDRELAQDLLDRFVAAGARMIFVGHSTDLRGPSDVVIPYPNHEDHMHVRFPRPRS